MKPYAPPQIPKPGDVWYLDLASIARRDGVSVTCPAEDAYDFSMDKTRPYLCIRVEGDTTTWLSVTSKGRPNSALVFVAGNRLQYVGSVHKLFSLPVEAARRAYTGPMTPELRQESWQSLHKHIVAEQSRAPWQPHHTRGLKPQGRST